MTKRAKSKKGTVKRRKIVKPPKGLTIKDWLPYVAVVVAFSIAALWPAIQADFTELDDKRLILENIPWLLDRPGDVWSSAIFTAHYKPLVLLSWMYESKIYGFSAVGFHAVNLFFHTMNAILVFFLTVMLARQFQLTKKQPELVALFTAIFFAVHPLHVESVAWAMGRKDLFYTGFFLLGLLSYLKYLKTPSIKWMAFVVLSFIASMLSKAPSIMFPFILLLIDYAYRKDLNVKSVVSKWPVFVALLLGLTIYGVFSTDPSMTIAGSTESRITKILSSARVSDLAPLSELPGLYAKMALFGFKGVFWYLHAIFPVKLALAYPYTYWIPLMGNALHIFPLILAGAFFALFKARKKYRLLFFTHVFFFTALVPALVRPGLGKGIFLSDRYVYLALFGLLFFLAGGLIHLLAKRKVEKKIVYAVLGSVALLMSVMSFTAAKKWDTAETLWTSNIEYYPQVAYALSNRGLYYQETGQTEKALEDFTRAVALEDDIHALLGKATILRKKGRYDEALADINRILIKEPKNLYALNAKANVFFARQQYQEAVQVYSTGLVTYPRDISMLANRAASYYYLRQYDAGIADLVLAEQINPNYPGLYSKMTVLYSGKQDWNNVVKYSNLFAAQQPNNHANLGDLGNAYQRLGRHKEAIDAYTRAINVFPKGKRYFNGRARSYRALGQQNAADLDQAQADIL
jgi:tetratricopeptide (TPR) repeat protein